MKLRVGLVGLGDDWEKRHRPALLALRDRFEVRAVCEQVTIRAEQVAREFGAATVEGYRALAERDDIDAVMILSRQWYGPLPILAACDAGKAVYCAGGLDLDPTRVENLRRRVDEAGIAFVAEFSQRLAPATLRLKELIATRLGAPRLLFCHRRKTTPTHRRNGSEKAPAISPVHPLLDLVDWCCYVVNQRPTSVFGLMHDGPAGAEVEEDYQMMNLDFSSAGQPGSGPTAQISVGRYLPPDWPEAISFRPPAAFQVACENGVAFVDLPTTLIWFDNAGRHMESLESERPVGEHLLSQFFRAVTSLVRSTSNFEDALLAQSVVLAGRQSHTEGRRIRLDDAAS